jgi:hypothetical protein
LNKIKANLGAISLVVFCLAFTFWWAWRLDSGFFVRRHAVPTTLEAQIADTFIPYLKGRSISTLRFGKKNAHASDNVPVFVASAAGNEEWLFTNPGIGPVLITVDSTDDELRVYWEMPVDTPFSIANRKLSQTLWDILVQYDDIQKVKNTYAGTHGDD